MTPALRGLFLASLSVSLLALGACASSTDANVSNRADATRLDSILDRAAREAKASGNKVETLSLLEKIYQRNPDDAAVATGYAQALRDDEQLNLARQVLFPFTEGKNAYPDAVTELAMVQLGLGQYKEAELTSRRAVEMAPDQGRPYLALGTALDAQNYHEQAEVAFRKGIDQWKGDPAPIMNNLALNLASQNKLDQAIDMLRKAKEVSPGRVELERNMRIITTLKEDADDFTQKQDADKTSASAKPAPVKKEAAKADVIVVEEVTVKKETAAAPKVKAAAKGGDVDTKQLALGKSAGAKPTTVKKQVVMKKDAAPSKVEPSASDKTTNSRGSTQNFN